MTKTNVNFVHVRKSRSAKAAENCHFGTGMGGTGGGGGSKQNFCNIAVRWRAKLSSIYNKTDKLVSPFLVRRGTKGHFKKCKSNS